jgi:hypothetical protein
VSTVAITIPTIAVAVAVHFAVCDENCQHGSIPGADEEVGSGRANVCFL